MIRRFQASTLSCALVAVLAMLCVSSWPLWAGAPCLSWSGDGGESPTAESACGCCPQEMLCECHPASPAAPVPFQIQAVVPGYLLVSPPKVLRVEVVRREIRGVSAVSPWFRPSWLIKEVPLFRRHCAVLT